MRIFLALLLSVAASSSEILRWDIDGDPKLLGGYRIYCRTDAEKPVATLDVGKATEWDTRNFLKGQPDGKKFFFTVKAYDTENVEGKPSNEISVVVEHKHIKGK